MLFGEQPKYMIHDNGSIFRSQDVQKFLGNVGIKPIRTGYKRPDQNGICERFIGILRRELLDQIIPLNERHLCKLLKEYVDNYYHPVRTHKNLDHMPPLAIETTTKPLSLSVANLHPKPILGGLYHPYETKAA
jgi:transposase InsO family protein